MRWRFQTRYRRFCEIRAAVDIADHMCQLGLDRPIETFQTILHTSEHSCEPDMVQPLYSVMRRHNVKPKGDTFRIMISLCMKIKDFEGLADVAEMNEVPTTSMYNAIMSGYYREKNIQRASMVLQQMKDADVKPDSETFSCLISHCESEEDIVKYRDDMEHAGVQLTKYVYMALINAYAKFGNYEMAKQVLLAQEIPVKFLNELKSVLVSSLASNNEIVDALSVYDEMKQAGCSLEPKSALCLIASFIFLHFPCIVDNLTGVVIFQENIRSEGELDRSAVEFLMRLRNKDKTITYIVIDQIFSQIWKMEPTNLQLGLDLLHAVKEDLELHPSRTSLDFFLSACVKAKDPKCAWLIWSEHRKADLPYNVSTFLRMYQALLASGKGEHRNS